jgi:hypothetical protein
MISCISTSGGGWRERTEIYSRDAHVALQKQLIGGVLEHSYFIRPPFYAVLFKPLATLPYGSAYLAFQSLCLVACFWFIS